MLVHLRSFHKKVKKFKHPLLEHAKPVTEAQIDELATKYFADRSSKNRTLLIQATFSAVRHLIGRYLGNWPVTRKYLDDMVGEALLSVIKTVDYLYPEVLDGRSVMRVISNRASRDIERMLYEMGSVTAPAKRTQETYAAQGEEVPYLIVESDLSEVSLPDNASQEEQDIIDAEEALNVMAARLQLDADLLKPDCRHLNAEEAAAKLGVHHTTILRRRAKLRSMYHIEFGG